MKDELIRHMIEEVIRTYLNQERSVEAAGGNGSGGTISGCTGEEHSFLGSAVPVEISARHVHLKQADVERLFGPGYILKKKKEISQPGQFLCEERVTLIGPRGQLQNVAVLGPAREGTQIEVSLTDGRALGIQPPVRLSGALSGAADLFVMSGTNMICAEAAVIAAQNHIHMKEADARACGVADNQRVKVRMNTARPLIFEDVVIRVSNQAKLAMHIDTDESAACAYSDGDRCEILSGKGVQTGSHVAMPAVTESEIAAEPDPMPEAGIRRGKRFLLAAAEAEKLVKNAGSGPLCLKAGTVITPLARDVIRAAKLDVKFI